MPVLPGITFLNTPEQTAAFADFLLACSRAESELFLLEVLSRVLVRLFPGVWRASVAIPVSDGRRLRVVALQGDTAIPLNTQVPIRDTSVGAAYRSGLSRVTAQISPDSRLQDLQILWEAGAQSGCNVPISTAGQIYGVLNLACTERRDWSAEVTLLEQLASVAAAQLHLQQRAAAAVGFAAVLREITELSRELALMEDEEALLSRAAQTQRKILPGVRANLGLFEAGEDRALLWALPMHSRRPQTILLENTNLAIAAERREVSLIGDTLESSLWEGPLLAEDGMRSAMSAPMLAGGVVLGTLNIGRQHPHAFSEQDTAIGRQLGASIGTALLALRSRQQLSEARAAAEGAARQRGNFLAVMAHELRTPLHAVVGMSQLLDGVGLPPEQQAMVSTIHSSSNILSSLIDDILDFSRLDRGEVELAPAAFDIRALVEEAADVVRVRLSVGVTLSTDCVPGLPRSVTADRGRVLQVLLNLLANAAKFTAAGTVRVVVRPLRDAAGISVSVSDTGVGIAAGALDKIFEPFRQAEAGTTRRFGGTGLGLSISRRLCQAMGGDIHVESVPGRGSTFTFTVRGALSGGVAAPRAPACPIYLAPLRVLVVDDNLINLSVAKAQLKRLGLSCETASSGAAAARCYAAADFDLVLMDLHLPGEDGREITRALRSGAGPHAVFVALTADARAEVWLSCQAAGMAELLSKPLRLEQLRALLSRVPLQSGAQAAALG